MNNGVAQSYTPTAVGADGAVYAVNNAVLFSVGKVNRDRTALHPQIGAVRRLALASRRCALAHCAIDQSNPLPMELHLPACRRPTPTACVRSTTSGLTIPTGMFGLLGRTAPASRRLMRTLATFAGRRPRLGPAQRVPGLPDGSRGATSTCCVTRRRAACARLPAAGLRVYPKVSAEDMLDHLARLKGLVNKGERADVVASLLRQTNLYDVRKKALGGYSGGMRQRSASAGAAWQPKADHRRRNRRRPSTRRAHALSHLLSRSAKR